MDDSCIFCQIINGKQPSQKVYSDDKTFAFLSIQPVRPGHVLIIPKVHEGHLFSLNRDYYDAIHDTAYKLAPVLDKVYKPKRIGLMLTGWEIDHTHLHLIPMLDHNDITSGRLPSGDAKFVTVEDLIPDQQKISAALN